MAYNCIENYKCDCCGKVVKSSAAPSSWWGVELDPPLDFKGEFSGSFDVCSECLVVPLRASGLKSFLQKLLDRLVSLRK